MRFSAFSTAFQSCSRSAHPRWGAIGQQDFAVHDSLLAAEVEGLIESVVVQLLGRAVAGCGDHTAAVFAFDDLG